MTGVNDKTTAERMASDAVPLRMREYGHEPEWDPSFTGVPRWTCPKCGRAALNYNGNRYGSAYEFRCDGTRTSR
jgi:hypothetical protein